MTKEGSSESKKLRKDTVKDLDAPADKAGNVKGGENTRPVQPQPGTGIPRRPAQGVKNPRPVTQ